MAEQSQGRVTFLATDIVGSVELWQRDTVAMSAALAVHDRMLRAIIPRSGGRVVKRQGDGVWAAFNRPLAALGRHRTPAGTCRPIQIPIEMCDLDHREPDSILIRCVRQRNCRRWRRIGTQQRTTTVASKSP